jgi:hypothetical protein
MERVVAGEIEHLIAGKQAPVEVPESCSPKKPPVAIATKRERSRVLQDGLEVKRHVGMNMLYAIRTTLCSRQAHCIPAQRS